MDDNVSSRAVIALYALGIVVLGANEMFQRHSFEHENGDIDATKLVESLQGDVNIEKAQQERAQMKSSFWERRDVVDSHRSAESEFEKREKKNLKNFVNKVLP